MKKLPVSLTAYRHSVHRTALSLVEVVAAVVILSIAAVAIVRVQSIIRMRSQADEARHSALQWLDAWVEGGQATAAVPGQTHQNGWTILVKDLQAPTEPIARLTARPYVWRSIQLFHDDSAAHSPIVHRLLVVWR